MKNILILIVTILFSKGAPNFRPPKDLESASDFQDNTIRKLSYYSSKRLEGVWNVSKNLTSPIIDLTPLFEKDFGLIRGNYYYDKRDQILNLTFNLIEGEYNDDRLLSFVFSGVTQENGQNNSGNIIYGIKQPSSIISTYKNILYENSFNIDVELELNFTSFFATEQSSKGIDLNMRIVYCKNNESDKCIQYNLNGDLLPESNGISSALVFMLLFVPLAVFKIYSGQKLIMYCSESGSGKKLSLISLTMITIWDTGILFNYMSELCDYSRFSLFFELIVGLTSLYIFLLDLSLIEIVLTMKVRDQLNDGTTESQNSRTTACRLLVRYFGRLAITMLALAFYLQFDSAKLLMSLYFVPQIVDTAAHQIISFEKIGLFIGNTMYTLLIVYFRMYPDKICHLQPMYSFCLIYIFLLALQIAILVLQYKRGPRFFLPSIVLKRINQKYNYLHELEDYQAEAECAICLGALNEDPMSETKPRPEIAIVINELRPTRGQIMKTPCGHSYHIVCLLEWFSKKQDCPVCRKKLKTMI